ncbi:MAG: acetylglutamate kinase, partial [Candidatus Sumerlaeia bacterium]|nr:acetylglutamate kinase [Candidatus Sumerlaeia bacterium]
ERLTEGTDDLGFVGRVKEVNVNLLKVLDDAGFIPVISPIGVDAQGQTLNINADFVAAHIAAALKAEKFILLTDVPGILTNPADEATLLPTIKDSDVDELISKGIITRGMLPKVQACKEALQGGVRTAHIIDGRLPHSLLLELFTDKGIGTQILGD